MQETAQAVCARRGFMECFREYKKGAEREFGAKLNSFDLGDYTKLEELGIYRAFSLTEDGVLIGFLGYIKTYMPHRQDYIASTESLFVMPQYRGRGSAKQLITAAMQDAKALGCRNFLLGLPYGTRRFMDFTPINTVFAHEL